MKNRMEEQKFMRSDLYYNTYSKRFAMNFFHSYGKTAGAWSLEIFSADKTTSSFTANPRGSSLRIARAKKPMESGKGRYLRRKG